MREGGREGGGEECGRHEGRGREWGREGGTGGKREGGGRAKRSLAEEKRREGEQCTLCAWGFPLGFPLPHS